MISVALAAMTFAILCKGKKLTYMYILNKCDYKVNLLIPAVMLKLSVMFSTPWYLRGRFPSLAWQAASTAALVNQTQGFALKKEICW